MYIYVYGKVNPFLSGTYDFWITRVTSSDPDPGRSAAIAGLVRLHDALLHGARWEETTWEFPEIGG